MTDVGYDTGTTRRRIVPVADLMDTNAGDEHHLDRNWQTCARCGRDRPVDLDDCPWCEGAWPR